MIIDGGDGESDLYLEDDYDRDDDRDDDGGEPDCHGCWNGGYRRRRRLRWLGRGWSRCPDCNPSRWQRLTYWARHTRVGELLRRRRRPPAGGFDDVAPF